MFVRCANLPRKKKIQILSIISLGGGEWTLQYLPQNESQHQFSQGPQPWIVLNLVWLQMNPFSFEVLFNVSEKCISNMEELTKSNRSSQILKLEFLASQPRQDMDLKLKVKEINEKVQALSSKHGVKFINNLSIDKTCLNSSKLHLNAKGSAILASHFIKFLRDGQSLSLLHPKKTS